MMAIHKWLILSIAALPLLSTAVVAQDARQYRAWDRNNDGVVTRAEWRGPLQEFRERDWNGDGVLSGREVWNDGWVPAEGSHMTDFAALDRNRNGRISRGEWRGDRAAFLRVDRNRDNQVTRSEFMNANAGAVADRTDDFDALDRDYSERIERSEWNGTRAAFNRLDANRDGVLTRRELDTGDVARASASDVPAAVEHTVDVDARQPWTHTGIYVNAGDFVTYRATGSIEMSNGGNDRATPSGALSGRRAANSPRPDQKAGTLLLRVGNGPVAVTGDDGSFTAQQSGQLSFGVNDDHFTDNRGQYQVWVAITPR
jgi:Ca2+-binding EF-hand superfamily protein